MTKTVNHIQYAIGLMTTYNTIQLALDGKSKREATERKKVVLELARKLNFESVLFPSEFKFSSREPLRYYLWMRELELWVNKTYSIKYVNQVTPLTPDLIEEELLLKLKLLIPDENDTRKK